MHGSCNEICCLVELIFFLEGEGDCGMRYDIDHAVAFLVLIRYGWSSLLLAATFHFSGVVRA
jgi:hypothetical protein